MNRTEKDIKIFYLSIDIFNPTDLDIEEITRKVNIELYYWEKTSTIIELERNYYLAINHSLNEQQQWQDFGHEMSHYFYDDCDSDLLSERFVDYCEVKADYFAYHFCVPTFMLQQLKGVDVYDVMRLFNVEFDFALRRLEMYQSKCLRRMNYHAMQASRN